MSTEREPTRVNIELEQGYRFLVDFGEGIEPLSMDEPPPLGLGSGPNPSAVLGAALGDCLSASLIYCLRRAHVDVEELRTEVDVVPERNADGRLRIGSVRVRLQPVLAEGPPGRIARCLDLFEDFCVVTESVRNGIDVEVTVNPTLPPASPPASLPASPPASPST